CAKVAHRTNLSW
nr:immunoglobulin heavy chain junction region [Macaca mulatta]MOY23763.1 immunoglobulin heavy chain junction region [Macaca mulatta]